MKPFLAESRRCSPGLPWLLWLATVVLWVNVWLHPVSSSLTRAGGLLLLALGWAGLLVLTWKWSLVRWLLLAASALCLGFLILPEGRQPDAARFRAGYVAGLRRYDGVPYYWGGESPKGIDCSGLIRRGLIDTAFLQGVRTLDPALVRYSIWLWWHDCSAKALGEQYRGLTVHLFDTPSLNSLADPRLLPGDIAVARDGVHVMACIGDNVWIEADPEQGKVIVVSVPSKDNVWFQSPMNVLRWKILQP